LRTFAVPNHCYTYCVAHLLLFPLFIRFLAYKTLEFTPAPLRGVLTAVLKPWGISSRAPTPAAAAALIGTPGTKEAELARVMGWPVS
jgi:hypothetical protein